MMRFIFKLVFWGFLGLMILPSVVDTSGLDRVNRDAQLSANETPAQNVFAASDALQMATGLAGHLKNICAHDPKTCENGARLVEAAIERAKKGAMVLAGMVEAHRTKINQVNDPTTTASIK